MTLISYAGKPVQPRKSLAPADIPQPPADIAPETISALSEALKRSCGRITPNVVAAAVADHFGWTIAGLTSRIQTTEYVRARWIGYYLSRTMTKSSLAKIAEAFGRSDHCCVFHGLKMYPALRDWNREVAEDEAAILKMLGLSGDALAANPRTMKMEERKNATQA